jgi:predicted acylesterase/phospholipase RssA
MNQDNLDPDLNSIPTENSQQNLTPNSQKKLPVYKNLVISGGGFNCFQFFGIIKYLDDNNLLKEINKYISVSAGSLISLLLIIGYKFNEIENFLIKFDFSKIFDLQFEIL